MFHDPINKPTFPRWRNACDHIA